MTLDLSQKRRRNRWNADEEEERRKTDGPMLDTCSYDMTYR
jgi:hypothetical protein